MLKFFLQYRLGPILDKLLEYKRNWIQHINRMSRNRLPRVMKHCSPTGRRNHGRPLKRLLDTWHWNGSTSGPTPCQIYDGDDDTNLAIDAYLLFFSFRILSSACFEHQSLNLLVQTFYRVPHGRSRHQWFHWNVHWDCFSVGGSWKIIQYDWKAHSEVRASWYILIIKPTRCANFSNLFLE